MLDVSHSFFLFIKLVRFVPSDVMTFKLGQLGKRFFELSKIKKPFFICTKYCDLLLLATKLLHRLNYDAVFILDISLIHDELQEELWTKGADMLTHVYLLGVLCIVLSLSLGSDHTAHVGLSLV